MANDLLTDQHLRIGEFGRRVGVDADLLRSWERRYGLLSPSRTAGGLRLYGPEDERRIRRMLEHLDGGLSAAEAARLTLRELSRSGPATGVTGPPGRPAAPAPLSVAAAAATEPAELWDALDRLDEIDAHTAFDRLLATFSLATLITDAVLPYLHELGERWRSRGDAVIAQEHFATALLRGRLLGLARGWGGGRGPKALLACFPGDFHDLGLICFGLALREHGWRITFLGTNTPFAAIAATAGELRPALTVLTHTNPGPAPDAEAGLARIVAHSPLALAGPGIPHGMADEIGAAWLTDDPFTAAEKIAAAAPGADDLTAGAAR